MGHLGPHSRHTFQKLSTTMTTITGSNHKIQNDESSSYYIYKQEILTVAHTRATKRDYYPYYIKSTLLVLAYATRTRKVISDCGRQCSAYNDIILCVRVA